MPLDQALTVINNWRSSHAFPLNTLQMNLRGKAEQADPEYLVAQRIKRLSSIEGKLRRLNGLKLSKMQDIGGCRAVLPRVGAVERVVSAFKDSRIKHKLMRENNYIECPKNSGYRGHHLIYSYYSDKNETFNGKKIEVQIRSSLQHAWATAVETVGVFTKQALKSSQGEKEWLRFFILAGSLFAIEEKKPVVANTSEDKRRLVTELRDYAASLEVIDRLRAYQATLKITNTHPMLKWAKYFLLELDPERKVTTITSFGSNSLEVASENYWQAEERLRKQSGGDAVLVSGESLDFLQRAYPNYFLDTSRFLDEVERAIA